MGHLFLVAIGGAPGASVRYGVALAAAQAFGAAFHGIAIGRGWAL